MKTSHLLLSLIILICMSVSAQEKHKPSVNKEGYYLYASKMPELIGGMESLKNKIVYPESEKVNRTQGKVLVEVYIDANGDIIKTAINKGINPALDKAALDAVNTTKWTPAYDEGKPVKCKIIIPIMFQLEEIKEVSNLPYESAKHMLDNISEYSKDVDKEPEPIGGMGSIMSLIKYPEQEKKNNIEGKVLVKAYIDENGNVTMASDIPQDNKHFIKAACDAIKKAKFTPAEKNGKKVKSVITIPVQFKMQ
jgi:TonB family protein